MTVHVPAKLGGFQDVNALSLHHMVFYVVELHSVEST